MEAGDDRNLDPFEVVWVPIIKAWRYRCPVCRTILGRTRAYKHFHQLDSGLCVAPDVPVAPAEQPAQQPAEAPEPPSPPASDDAEGDAQDPFAEFDAAFELVLPAADAGPYLELPPLEELPGEDDLPPAFEDIMRYEMDESDEDEQESPWQAVAGELVSETPGMTMTVREAAFAVLSMLEGCAAS